MSQPANIAAQPAAVGQPAPVGRPRSGGRQRPGGTPREEILDAAAELFTRRGYAATSTRMIAEAVGIRQASLYYHVSNKEELLAELLAETVRPSLSFAATLTTDDGDVDDVGADDADLDSPDADWDTADARLFALAAFDTGLLCSGRWNLGALYLLPEVRGERFAAFRAERAELRAHYGRLINQLTARSAVPGISATNLTDLVFGLVESVITIRSEREITDVEAITHQVAASCLRIAGVSPGRIADLVQQADDRRATAA